MPADYSQLRSRTNDSYPASQAGRSKNYQRGDLVPVPSMMGGPLHGSAPHGMGDEDETYTGPTEEKQPLVDPVRTLVHGISGGLGAAVSSPAGSLLSGNGLKLDPKEMLMRGGVGAGTVALGSAARQALTKLLRG